MSAPLKPYSNGPVPSAAKDWDQRTTFINSYGGGTLQKIENLEAERSLEHAVGGTQVKIFQLHTHRTLASCPLEEVSLATPLFLNELN